MTEKDNISVARCLESKGKTKNSMLVVPRQSPRDVAYKLKIPKTWRNIYLVINRLGLRLYIRPAFEQQTKKSNTILTLSPEQERIQEVGTYNGEVNNYSIQ